MIATMIAIYVLIVLDSMFSGICAASGRNALIHKRAYYLKAMLFGVVCGQVTCVVGSVLVFTLAGAASDVAAVTEELTVVGQRMVHIYSVYAVVVLATFLVRAIPSVDVRSLTSTLVFGPFTFIRSAIIALGVVYGVMGATHGLVVVIAVLAGVLMLPLRMWMSHLLDCWGIEMLMGRRAA